MVTTTIPTDVVNDACCQIFIFPPPTPPFFLPFSSLPASPPCLPPSFLPPSFLPPSFPPSIYSKLEQQLQTKQFPATEERKLQTEIDNLKKSKERLRLVQMYFSEDVSFDVHLHHTYTYHNFCKIFVVK